MLGESARWHEGRLWLANWGAQEVLAVDVEGRREVAARVPETFTFSIDWLPDGRLLVVSGQGGLLLRQEPDGTLVPHADLFGLSDRPWNEIVVDGRGHVYVNGLGFRFGEEDFRPGIIALAGAGGSVRQVADGVAFPNGMVVTPDGSTLIVAESFAGRLTAFSIGGDGSLSNRRVWAELGFGGDGICLDAEGAIWTPSVQDGRPACLRVREGGEVLQRIELDRSIFACALGGADGCTLFMLVCDWDFAKSPGDNLATLVEARTGRVLTARAPAPGARWPSPDR